MARQTIDIGVQGNDGTGDSIRESFRKVNDNFQQLFAIFGSGDTIAFTDLDDTPESYTADQIIVANADGDALVAKNFVGGEGILVDHSDPNQIRVVNTGSKLINDDTPTLSNHLNANQQVIANSRDPSPDAATLFNNLYDTNLTEDDIVITKGYADKKYLQTSIGTSLGTLVRIRNEPTYAAAQAQYIVGINNWVDGYLYKANHGYNNGVNGAAFVYNNTGNAPASGLIKGETYYVRLYDSDKLGVYGTRSQALDDINFDATRIIVNDPGVEVSFYIPSPNSYNGTSIPSGFTYNNIDVISVTGVGSGMQVTVAKTGITALYNGTNTTITITTEGIDYVSGAQLKILGTALGGTSPANDLTFSLVNQYRGIETFIDAGYDPELEGNWLADEALPRKATVRRQGDTMEGALLLHDHPGALAGAGSPNGLDDLQAATKFYVDSSSFASATNLFVATSGDDTQFNTPAGKEGRAFAYAYSTIGAACQRAEEIINASAREPGPYRQVMTHTSYSYACYLESFAVESTTRRTLSIFTNGQGVDQSDSLNRDLREGSIIKGLRSGATGKVISYNGTVGTNDEYLVELLHKATDLLTYQSNYFYAADQLTVNKDFIAEQVIAYLDMNYAAIDYDKAGYLRNAKSIVEALAFDIKFGGNRKTLDAATAYWRGQTRIFPEDQLALTLDSIDYIFQLAEAVIEETLIPNYVLGDSPTALRKRLTGEILVGEINIITNPDQNLLGSPGENGSVDLVNRLVDVILFVVENGPNADSPYVDFLLDETLEFGQPVPEANITIRVESGVYYEQYPIRVPANVSIKGDEFRRVVIRPAPGQSLSPWASMYFFRDDEFDGMTRTYNTLSNVASSSGTTVTLSSGTTVGLKEGMYVTKTSGTGKLVPVTRVVEVLSSNSFTVTAAPTVALSGATLRALDSSNLAPTGVNFGYHYLTDPTGVSAVFDDAIAKTGGHNSAASALASAKTSITSQTITYINTTYPDLEYSTDLCARDIGLIIDAVVYDLTDGGTTRSTVTGYSYKRNVSSRIAITTQLTETVAAISRVKFLVENLLASDVTAKTIAGDLISGIINIILGEKNPPKENKDMDVFMLNDGCIIRNVTCQGHGGFMCILDPEGQIQTKSPYFQTCTSLSGSTNRQRYAGGMLIDGFSGNLEASIQSKTNPNTLTFGNLFVRKPGVPTAFFINGARYQINAVENWDQLAGTATITLDEGTPYISAVTAAVDITLETPGNRSMLSNDFTQVNDLGYGLVATNNGISEAVSEFTYYCWTSYYAVNGGQIRSVSGSSCNGEYGLRASGRDPREVPDVVVLGDAVLQQAKIYKSGALSTKSAEGDISFYIDNYRYVPFGTSEAEIDNTPMKSSLQEDSLTIVSGGSGYAVGNVLTVAGGTIVGDPTALIVSEIDNGTLGGPGVITKVNIGELGAYGPASVGTFTNSPVGVYPTVTGTFFVTGGGGTLASFNGTFLGTRTIYETTTVEETTTVGTGVNSSGTPISKSVLKINLDSQGASGPKLTSNLYHGQIVSIRALQNLRFTDVFEIKPVRPSTALEFQGAASGSQVLRTLAYNLTDSIGAALPANQAILTFDNNFDYVLLEVDYTKLTGGFGSAAGDTKLAVNEVTGAKLVRVNSGDLIFAHDGRLHKITGYTASVGPVPAYISFTNYAYGQGTIIDPTTDAITTGLRSGFSTVRNTTIRAGIDTGALAEITVRISTCRATGHDFLDVGSGSFNDTNYPSNLYGAPVNDPSNIKEVVEETQGRVFYVSTDQNGVFKVGKFFQVDQGTGNVTFNAPITLTDLNGLGFKKGSFVTEFSNDADFADMDPNTVPTEYAAGTYIDYRLGFDRDGNPSAKTIGPGVLPLTGEVPMTGDLDMAGPVSSPVPHRIINVAYPLNGTDAATKVYVDDEISKYDQFAELREVNLMSPAAGDISMFTGAGSHVINTTVGGDITATFTSTSSSTVAIEYASSSVSNELYVASVSSFPSSGYFKINNEIFSYTGKSVGTNNFTGVSRARYLTTAATHAVGNTVIGLNQSVLDLQINAGTIVNADVSDVAAIAQSKINLTNVTAYVDTATTAAKGLASFSSNNFAVTVGGEVTIKDGGVALAEITTIAAGTLLGNLGGVAAAPSEITPGALISAGINSSFTTIDSGANVLTRRVNSLNISPSSTFVSLSGTAPVGSGTISNVPVTSVTGSGNGARVNIPYGSGVYGGANGSITVAYGGNGYAEGDQLKVDGAALGGSSGGNDLTFIIAATGTNIDTTTYLGIHKVSSTAEADSLVKTDSGKNLGTAGNRFNTIYGAVTDLAGGTIGDLPYQNAAGDTVFLSPGTSGYYLQSNGTGAAPTWEALAIPTGAAGDLTGTTLASNVINSSLQTLGTLSALTVGGLSKFGVEYGITASGDFVAAPGTAQAAAYALSKSINVVTTVPADSGVRLPDSVPAGYRIIIRNNTATPLNVWPPVGYDINGLGENVPYPLGQESALEFICAKNATPTGGFWFIMNATFAA